MERFPLLLRGLWHASLLAMCCTLFLPATSWAQSAASCNSPDWFVVQQSERGGKGLSRLCRAQLEAAEDHRQVAEKELKAVISASPQSTVAYAAHSTLTHFYFRAGRFHEASAQISAMLSARPDAPDLHNVQSLFALLATNPDVAIVRSHPAIVRTHVIDGNVFAPVMLGRVPRSYMLDTGLNLSMMSESEAKSLGLTPQSSNTAVSDISGLSGPGARIVEVESLTIGGTVIRHVPFLVAADTNGAFVGVPKGEQGIVGIQPLLALGTLAFNKDDTLSLDGRALTAARTVPLLFDGPLPLSRITYKGRTMTVTFDMGATQTTLNPPFVKLFPQLLDLSRLESHTLNGISGSTAQRSASLDHLELVFGHHVDLSPATILLDQTTGTSAYAAANLGYDLMQQAPPCTMDFRRMLIPFRQNARASPETSTCQSKPRKRACRQYEFWI